MHDVSHPAGPNGGQSLAASVAHADELAPPPPPPVRLMSYGEFLAGFTPPDYLVDGMLQRRFLYALTAPPGGGKTAAALLLSTIAGSVAGGATFAGRQVERGNALYLCAENADDVRMRLIGLRAKDPSRSPLVPPFIWFEPVRRPLADMLEPLAAQAPPKGFQLVVVDTSPAYFPGHDENSNVEMGEHARTLRRLTELPGGPTVVALCHPLESGGRGRRDPAPIENPRSRL
jgi:RecA-family ATPase